MSTRNQVKSVFAVGAILLVCCSSDKPFNGQGNTTATTQQPAYWLVIMWTLIGTRFISEVCPLPVDDSESVAAAANGWGMGKGFMTVESDVHRFNSRADAETFRRENGSLALKLNANELKKYLCVGQTSPPPKDYWVVIMRNNEGSNLISEICFLPPYDSQTIAIAAGHWGLGKGFMTIAGGARRFRSQEQAETFRQAKGLAALNLNASVLNKYLCASRAGRSTPDKTSRRSTSTSVRKR